MLITLCISANLFGLDMKPFGWQKVDARNDVWITVAIDGVSRKRFDRQWKAHNDENRF